MTSASSKSSRPDQMAVYLESIANVAGSEVSFSSSVVAKTRIDESPSNAGACFSDIYENIITAGSPDPADFRRKIDTVTSVDESLQKLTGLDDMAAAQSILDSMKAPLAVLKEEYPDIRAQVDRCLDSGLEGKPKWRKEWRKELR